MNPLLIIGQASGRMPGETLGGRCGARLASCAGMTLTEFLARTDRVNLLEYWTDGWRMLEARERCKDLVNDIAAHRRTVLLGRWVAAAFRNKAPLFDWTDAFRDGGSLIAVAPHPSGRNRWWNDPENVARAQVFWRDLLA